MKCEICKNKIKKKEMSWTYTVQRENKEFGVFTQSGYTICNYCKNENIHLFPTIDLVGVPLKKGR
jgi:hypothetical protein